MTMQFYRCDRCGNVILFLRRDGELSTCCGQGMTRLIPGAVEASAEKHVPVVSIRGGVVHVEVGAVEHPMAPEHFIQWIALETNQGGQIKYLKPGQAPEVDFALAKGEQMMAAYEYCNLHGLWMA